MGLIIGAGRRKGPANKGVTDTVHAGTHRVPLPRPSLYSPLSVSPGLHCKSGPPRPRAQAID
jgi:hypothetical protein